MTVGWEESEEEEERQRGRRTGSQRALPCYMKNYTMRLSTASIQRAFL